MQIKTTIKYHNISSRMATIKKNKKNQMFSPDNKWYNAILFSHEKEQNPYICNLDGTWRHYAKWNKTDRQILHDVTYMEMKKKKIEIVSRKVVARSWDVGEIEIGVCVLNCVQLFATPLTVAHQAPLSIGFPRQECWSGLPFLSPGNCMSLVSPTLASRF